MDSEITNPFRKCVSGMEQLPSEKPLTPGLEPTTIGFDREIATGASDHCATTETSTETETGN